MADYNKSIEIAYKADLKSLISELKKMPGMTASEAKKMVSALDTQLKQAEKAAKRTGQNTARGMKQVQVATFQASQQMKTFRTSARSADRVFGELSTGLELVSPELGAMAGFASQASSGIEALGRAVGSANPIFLAITVVAASAALAYQLFAVDTKAVEEQSKKTAEKLRELRDATAGIEMGANNARLELAILQGQISTLDAEIAKSEFEIRKEQEAGLQASRDRLKVFEEALELVQRRSKAGAALTEEETVHLHALQKSIPVLKDIDDLNTAGLEGFQIRQKAAARLNKEIEFQHDELERLNDVIDEQVATQEQVLLLKEEQKQQEKEIREQEKARGKAAKEREKEARAAQVEAQQQEKAKLVLLAEVEKIQSGINKQLMNESQAIEHKYDAQIQRLQEIQKELGDQVETETAIADLKFLKSQELYELEQKQLEKLNKARLKSEKEQQQAQQQRIRRELDFAGSLVTSYGTVTSSLMTMYENMGKEQSDQMIKLFRLNKSAEIANIAMITARGITEAAARFAGRPVRKALAIGGMVAAGATQTAAVASTPPPVFDMGGMIGNFDRVRPGDTMVRATAGEAILDTSTVQRLGGAEGVRALQNGGSAQPSVIVMNPFKHFDRYNKSALRRTSALNKEAYKTRRFGSVGY
jgi:hypothetical protein